MVSHDDSSEPELRNPAGLLRRRWNVLAVATLVVVGVALVASLTQPSRYRADSQVLVRQPTTAGSVRSEPITDRSLATEVGHAQVGPVLDAVRDVVGDEPNLGVRADDDANVLHFTAESRTPSVAAAAADRYAEAFIARRGERIAAEYLAAAERVQELITELDVEIADGVGETSEADAEREAQRQRYNELRADLLLSAELAEGTGAQAMGPAEVPDAPFEPTTFRHVVLALIVGLAIGTGGMVLFDRLDTTVRTVDDLRRASGGIPNLAVIPEDRSSRGGEHPQLASTDEPASATVGAYRSLRESIQFVGIDRDLSTIAFTSPGDCDGTTTTAANLAVVCARAGQRVVLVDCDLRRPGVHEFFGLSNEVGFTTVLLGEASLDTAAHRIAHEPGLVVITSGPLPPDPSEVLSGKRARSLVGSMAAQADLVIVDSSAVLSANDPLVVSGMVDALVLVASAGHTDRGQVRQAMEHLHLADAPVVGTVLNHHTARRGGSKSRRDRSGGGSGVGERQRPGFGPESAQQVGGADDVAVLAEGHAVVPVRIS